MLFFEFGIKDVVDIFAVALMLYYIYRLMKESRSLNVFIGLMIFVVVWLFVSQVLEMRLLGSILDKLVSVGMIALIVLFQEEIRKFLYTLGGHERMKRLTKLFSNKHQDKVVDKSLIMPIVMACLSMSKGKVGALIVISRSAPLNSPLHDGAMIIARKRIQAAGCILPVSHNLNIPKQLGLRHRAALGISQESDAIAIIVSEETGSISVAMKGEFQLSLTAEKLESILTNEIG